MERKQRVEYIDFFRGIGILLMIMNHVDFGGVVYNVTHAFHMPMFFIIAGFLYSKKSKAQLSTGSFIKKKAKSLLLPYLVFGLLHYIVWIVLYGFSLKPLSKLFFFNTEEGMPIAGALWFLTSLFLTDVMFFVLDRYIKSRLFFYSLVIILSIFGTVAQLVLPFTLPFAMSSAFVGLGLFQIGVLIKAFSQSDVYQKLKQLKPAIKCLEILFALSLTSVLVLLNGAVNMRDGRYSVIPLFWVNATLATALGMIISSIWMKQIKVHLLNQYICSIGRESIVYLCLNQLVILILKKLTDVASLPFLLNRTLILAAVLGILYLTCRISLESKLKVLFGK